jgi:hypothetical protein
VAPGWSRENFPRTKVHTAAVCRACGRVLAFGYWCKRTGTIFFSGSANFYLSLMGLTRQQRAVALLADIRLNRDHASKIIRAISLSPESAPLIRRYIQTSKPPLVEPPDIECYALALADFSLLDAWQFARTFNERDSIRTRLLLKLFEWIISRKNILLIYFFLALSLTEYFLLLN